MKKILLTSIFINILTITSVFAQTQSGFRIHANYIPKGISDLNDRLKSFDANCTDCETYKATETTNNIEISAEIVNQFHDNLTVGGGFGFIRSDEGKFKFSDTFVIEGSNVNGVGNYNYSVQSLPVFVNTYAFYPFETFRPYVGVGVGYIFAWGFEDFNMDFGDRGSTEVNNTYNGHGFGFQLQTGTTIKLSDTFTLNLGIKYRIANITNLDGNLDINDDISDDFKNTLEYTNIIDRYARTSPLDLDLGGFGISIGVSLGQGN
ncbi:MAG: hypothetical protein DWQ06_12545 [Calditrichaeota bacterium]|nr:MAG: hypothetical protein DWQ06_12545 [Calditrichota bacterium]